MRFQGKKVKKIVKELREKLIKNTEELSTVKHLAVEVTKKRVEKDEIQARLNELQIELGIKMQEMQNAVDFLEKNNVAPWSDMPAWIPETGDDFGVSHVDISKAVHAGLTFTPLAQTIKDIYDWEFERPHDHELKAGLKPEREKELLELLSVQ